MKTDTQLHRDVLDQLHWEPSVREAEIGTSVKDGVVALTGFVDSFAEKWAAVRAVEQVKGVRAVVDELAVNLPSAHVRTDTDIAHAAVSALAWDIEVPAEQVKTTIRDGWITLEGDVEWQFQRHAAGRAVRNLTGVRGVSNLISVKPKRISPYDVTQKIKETLRRSAEVEASHISVEAENGTVTLNGTVRSYAERRDAERAAWSAPGVVKVNDHLAVTI